MTIPELYGALALIAFICFIALLAILTREGYHEAQRQHEQARKMQREREIFGERK